MFASTIMGIEGHPMYQIYKGDMFLFFNVYLSLLLLPLNVMLWLVEEHTNPMLCFFVRKLI